MTDTLTYAFPEILRRQEAIILNDWLDAQARALTLRLDLMSEIELRSQSTNLLRALTAVVERASLEDLSGPEWAPVLGLLEEISDRRAQLGYTSSETATFVFSLQQILFGQIRTALADESTRLVDELWVASRLMNNLGLYTTEVAERARAGIIARQQQEILELSTPVMRLWDDILALPLIGTLDSSRTQVVMENLLQAIVETGSTVAVIDITGVPVVDTLVAQHLLKAIAAARLMGADCILSGIRPQIAQTIVHLGVNLEDVVTKSSLSDAFALALKRTGKKIVPAGPAA